MDESFLPTFKVFWGDIILSIDQFYDIGEWWDLFAKPRIKEFCIMFSVNRRKNRNQTKQFLLRSCFLIWILRPKTHNLEKNCPNTRKIR